MVPVYAVSSPKQSVINKEERMLTKQLLAGIVVFATIASINGNGNAATEPVNEHFAVPPSANDNWKNVCVDKTQNLNGDFQESKSFLWLAEGQWSVGPSVSTQLVKYDMAKKQAGFNTSVGAGASFRFYRNITIKNKEGKPEKDAEGNSEVVTISQIRRECRQSSFVSSRGSYLAAPMFSITPTLYATKPTTAGDLSIEPALLLGFFEDILNVGVGFTLTGPPGEKGNVFLLMSIGTGFSF